MLLKIFSEALFSVVNMKHNVYGLPLYYSIYCAKASIVMIAWISVVVFKVDLLYSNFQDIPWKHTKEIYKKIGIRA